MDGRKLRSQPTDCDRLRPSAVTQLVIGPHSSWLDVVGDEFGHASVDAWRLLLDSAAQTIKL